MALRAGPGTVGSRFLAPHEGGHGPPAAALAHDGPRRCNERICPVALELPPVACAADLVPALAAVVGAVGRGELTPEEGRAVAGLLEAQRRAVETAELERRVAALEECLAEPLAEPPGAAGR